MGEDRCRRPRIKEKREEREKERRRLREKSKGKKQMRKTYEKKQIMKKGRPGSKVPRGSSVKAKGKLDEVCSTFSVFSILTRITQRQQSLLVSNEMHP